METLQWFPMQF